MDQRARFPDEAEVMETFLDALRQRIHKASPVSLSEDSADGHTVKAQQLVQSVYRDQDGKVQLITPSALEDIPVHFKGGGGITTTHALKRGDEGFIVGTNGNLDFWHQNGGVQTPGDARAHTASDSFFVPGVRSTPRKLKGVSKDSTQTRTDDKQSVHDVSHSAVSSVRETSAHQVNGAAIQSEKDGSKHIVDGSTIQNLSGKILLNCA